MTGCLGRFISRMRLRRRASRRARRCRLQAVVTVIMISGILSAHSGRGQSPRAVSITDADKREILALLFQRELAAVPDGEPVSVLVGPGVEPGWLPEVPGISFRRLGYDEVRGAREYYDVMGFERRSREIRVELLRGNYCKKVGRIYRLRREGDRWNVYPANLVETYAAYGSCPGCETGSGARYSVRSLGPPPAEKADDDLKPTRNSLSLRGKVLAVHCRRREKEGVGCSVDLELELFNAGDRPVIILQPDDDYSFWHGATSLALTEADARSFTYVYSSSAWPSVYPFPMYKRLAERLDQPAPPRGVTRVLRPGEGWTWGASVTFNIGEANSCDGSVGVEIGWEEIKRLTAPLWLRVSYEMWPFNVENFRPDLGGKLRSRWARYGVLYLEEKSDRYWFAHVTSEPIELDMRHVELP